MKRFSLIFIQFAVAVTMLNCKKSSRCPGDFRVRIDATTNSYNSGTQVFTRKYVRRDTTIRITLDEAEFQSIYDLDHEIRFLKFPPEFEQAEYGEF